MFCDRVVTWVGSSQYLQHYRYTTNYEISNQVAINGVSLRENTSGRSEILQFEFGYQLAGLNM